ncbi:hypothetical protein WA026_019588 [Henosepilachna vigintioctopunctata]|uniref:Uncharacterized protein n=1 Tax=Henosepilachna vigintioctopunctata TaxID=420089 RepID=A0AAW1TW16_9CUCU
MKISAYSASVLLHLYGVAAFIIPDEIPSLLSVVYSNIPVIKKGTDSRIGWGFRLGDRADFQFLTELGPQKYTQPLANEPDKTVSNKRSALNDLASELWAQRQEDKKRAQNNRPEEQVGVDTKAGSWLQNWSNGMKKRKPVTVPEKSHIHDDEIRPGLGIGEIDAKSVIPEDESFLLKTLLSNNKVSSKANNDYEYTSSVSPPTILNTTITIKNNLNGNENIVE